ncbi:hypothetical protein C0J50_20148, partial [Silurus asotus]
EYKMSSRPRGVCLIINNMDFGDPNMYRHGSDMDEDALNKVFVWLGFTVEVHKDKTAEQMKAILKTNGQKQHEGDCFVCCILSHGTTDGVYGTDKTLVLRDDIYSPFNGASCPSLNNKPKVFFIQACRGELYHPIVQSDAHSEENAGEETEEEEELDTDVGEVILNGKDFFMARSTIKGYYSLRSTISGSWFIQSLCKQLQDFCPQPTTTVSSANLMMVVELEVVTQSCVYKYICHKQSFNSTPIPSECHREAQRETLRNLPSTSARESEITATLKISEYKMSSRPRGVCLIINNMDFGHPDKFRHGSDKDEEALIKVFKWLGFPPEVHRNQTAEQMKTILSTNSRKQHEGDCFVCCILSHGTTDGVYGTDEEIVSGSDIYEVFNGTFCPSLINKPKVFFIQACRGIQHQLLVKVQADGHSAVKAGGKTEEEEELEADAVQITIPAEADFLVARSTVKGFYSFRGTSGSWFIQSLCEQLNKH